MWFLGTYSWDKRFCIQNSSGTLFRARGFVFIAYQWARTYLASQMNLYDALGEWKSRTPELGGLPEWWFSSEPGTSLGI